VSDGVCDPESITKDVCFGIAVWIVAAHAAAVLRLSL
jgi:hypothetical protein